jgi:recombination protein RecA
MNEKLIEALKTCGVKKAQIEKDLGMSINSLSGMLSGSKEIPGKWIQPLTDYVAKLNQPEAQTETEVVPPSDLPKLEVTQMGKIVAKPNDEKLKEMKKMMDNINKDYGAGTVMMLGDSPQSGYEVISTGSLGLDRALGIGGFPKGRIVEIYGTESSGKTTIATHVIANAQRQGLKCLLVDAENSFDPEYASSIGVQVDDLFYCQPSYGEQGLEVADKYICDGKVGVVVIDSVAALVPKSELEGEMGDSKMGLHARLMSQACRKMTSSISKNNVICIFINQLRSKIGVVYGSPDVTTGGMALQFYASIRLDVRRSTKIENGEVQIGNKVRVKVVKNKCAPPFKVAEFDIIYGEGINTVGEIVDIGVETGIIQKSGSWYAYETSKLGQGRDSVIALLKDNEPLLMEIQNKIK